MNEMQCGLASEEIKEILQAIAQFTEINKAVLYGSRAKGNFKKASDVDIAIFGKNVTLSTVIGLSELLNEESYLPYFFDILYYNQTDNIALKEHVKRVGKVLYKFSINQSVQKNT